MQAGCVRSSASGSIVRTVLHSVLENIPRGVLGSTTVVYLEVSWEHYPDRFWCLIGFISQAGWEHTIQCNQECNAEHTWQCAMKCSWQFD